MFFETIVATLDGSAPLDSLIPPACGMPHAPVVMELPWGMACQAWCMVEREVWEEGRGGNINKGENCCQRQLRNSTSPLLWVTRSTHSWKLHP